MFRGAILFLLIAVSAGCAQMEGGEVPAVGPYPVVVELFTSQGCSSCPPADRALREIARAPELRDRVVPLSFHVSYWNYLGWSDPFSSELWTERQRRYARAVGVDVYTPQIVVNGRRAMVGSRGRDVRRAILEESHREPAVELSIENRSIRAGRLSLDVTASSRDADVWVAVWESGLVTQVERGENRGRRLENDRVVRWIELVELDDDANRGHVVVDLGSDWNTAALGVVAFAQNPESMEILGAATN